MATVIRHPEIAAAMREAMERKGLKTADINVHLGLKRAEPQAYNWVSGRSSPAKKIRPQVAKLLDLDVADLTPRPLVTLNGQADAAAALQVRQPVVRTLAHDQLSFALQADGQARLRLDLVGPAERVGEILLLLMKQQLVPAPHIEERSDNA